MSDQPARPPVINGLLPEDHIPPEYRGQTWEQRHPHAPNGVIQSRFPPATMGVPAEDFEPFLDFRIYQWGKVRREHPEYFCEVCELRLVGMARDDKGNNLRDAQGRLVPAKRCGPCIGGERTGGAS